MNKFLTIFICVFLLAACQSGAGNKQIDLSSKKSSLRRIADSIKQSGNVQVAAQMEAQIIEMDQSDASSFIALSDSVQVYGSNYDALEVLELGEKLNPQNADLKVALAKVHLQNSDTDAALAKLSQVEGKKSRDYYNAKGVALDLNGEYAQAQETYSQGLREYQRDNLLLNNLALSKLFLRDYDGAIAILKELSTRNSDKKYANNLALAYGMKGDIKKARRILGRDLTQEEISENLRIYKELR